jgi:hypothetical protein
MTAGMKLLVAGSEGQFAGQLFAERYDTTEWNVDIGQAAADMETLREGPLDHGCYWEALEYILENAYSLPGDGEVWHLGLVKGSLYAYCYNLMTEAEKALLAEDLDSRP